MKYPRQNAEKNKLFILFTMQALSLPLTFSQLEQIAVGADLMDYFSLKQTLAGLEESGLIQAKSSLSGGAYVLTPEGCSMNAQFAGELPASMRDYITRYAGENRERLARERIYHADFSKIANGQYMACCRATENGLHLIELNINLPTRELAQSVCDKWAASAPEVYGFIMEHMAKQV